MLRRTGRISCNAVTHAVETSSFDKGGAPIGGTSPTDRWSSHDNEGGSTREGAKNNRGGNTPPLSAHLHIGGPPQSALGHDLIPPPVFRKLRRPHPGIHSSWEGNRAETGVVCGRAAALIYPQG